MLKEDIAEDVHGKLRYAATPNTGLPASVALRSCGERERHYSSRVKGDGSFDFPAVAAGEYYLLLDGANGMFARSISISGRESAKRRIVVAPGQPMGILDVELARSAASIAGVVEPHGIVPGKAGVVLQSLESGCVNVALADNAGRFQESGVPPGEYRLLAWDDLDKVEYRNPKVLRQFSKQSTEVTIDGNASASGLEIPVIHAEN